MRHGPRRIGEDAWEFSLWAPKSRSPRLVFPEKGRSVFLEKQGRGWWRADVAGLAAGERYVFELKDGLVRADPASHHQPDGVRGSSALVDHDAFAWTDADFVPPAPNKRVIYELHVGTFTPQGTFDGAGEKLDHLAELGATCLEIMPVAAFPGGRNWGYDGVFPYAAQHTYGGPDGLKRLVDACHARGLAVILDVVYNHLGPEGNHLRDFGPYFSKKYATPWGESLNFDGPDSDSVREFFLQNALYWIEHYHIDGLRLDAVDEIRDDGPNHFLRELSGRVKDCGAASGRNVFLIAESMKNDPRMVREAAAGGHGLDGVWNDDFHHAAHRLLTGERNGYYVDYGRMAHLAKAVGRGFVLTGQYSEYYRRRYGLPAPDAPAERFVSYLQNHDQIGNRLSAERTAALVSPESLRLAAVLLFTSPGTPLLFMGEEFGEDRPFPYFVSHRDPALLEAVRRGRKREFAAFMRRGEPADPALEKTFQAAVLDWDKARGGDGAGLSALHRELIRLRLAHGALLNGERKSVRVWFSERKKLLAFTRQGGGRTLFCLFNFSARTARANLAFGGGWRKALESTETRWGGSGAVLPATPSGPLAPAGRSAVVYEVFSPDAAPVSGDSL